MSQDQREQMDRHDDFTGVLEGAEPLGVCLEPERYAGYGLYDPLGNRLGRVERIFTNGGGGPEYVKVRVGPWRRRSVFIPTNELAVDDSKRILSLL